MVGPTKRSPSGWYPGMLHLLNLPCPDSPADVRAVGFSVGKTILGLYLVEILLKDALVDLHIKFDYNHNLHQLFELLPKGKRSDIEQRYSAVLHNQIERTVNHAATARNFLKFLGNDPITDARYFWTAERFHNVEKKSFYFFPHEICCLVDALAAVLHDLQIYSDLRKLFETKFLPIEEFSAKFSRRTLAGGG